MREELQREGRPRWQENKVPEMRRCYPQEVLEKIPKGQILTVRGKYLGGFDDSLHACELAK
jgi:hypothetical protein